ncbi:MAG TPA: hypothetical protein VFV99_08095 [Kofleriaceae bacterium]|nr:hypothetical protein [Kofleriaceae bacterium]
MNTVVGGAEQAPIDDEGPQQRTWGQVGREYAAACVQGAGQALMYGGMPRSKKEAAMTAAFGCATGVGTKAIDDLAGAISR